MFLKRKLKKILLQGLLVEESMKKKKTPDEPFHEDLVLLDRLLQSGNLEEAKNIAQRVEEKITLSKKKKFLFQIFELVLTLGIALFLAGIIRQSWFELYEIPTGSMRPTFKEKDRVLVSKSAFGINVPFLTSHLIFSKDRIHRGDTIVITGDGIDLPDVDTVYFGIFPGKRRYVKRLAALPGDYVYFYGGDLFILDKDGQKIHLKAQDVLKNREYVPFLSFEGRVESIGKNRFGRKKSFLIKHMNIPIGLIEMDSQAKLTCGIAYKGKWIPEFSDSDQVVRNHPQTIGEFWGIKNYGKCRLLLPNELPKKAETLGYSDPKAVAWLEVHHSPTLPQVKRLPPEGELPFINLSVTWIPLYEEQCSRLFENLYTARLVVQNGKVSRYYYEGTPQGGLYLPYEIPDGTYEFFNGKAYSIGFGGTSTPLPDTHPIYPKSIKDLAFWFNAGIDVRENSLDPTSSELPTRFAYFNNNDLCVLNAPTILKSEPIMPWFEKQEITRQAKDYTYFAFQDSGSPLQESDEFFHDYGLKIPEGYYLALGDNHAMSVDCRIFGLVPENNIQGTPIMIFWPFGPRFGAPLQASSPLSPYSLAIIVIVLLGASIYFYQKKRHSRKLLKNLRAKP